MVREDHQRLGFSSSQLRLRGEPFKQSKFMKILDISRSTCSVVTVIHLDRCLSGSDVRFSELNNCVTTGNSLLVILLI